MGLDLSPIASFSLYVEVVYRLCNLKQLGPTPNYNKSYQKDPNIGWLSAMAWVCIVVLEDNDKGTDDGASSPSPVIRPIDFGAALNDVLYAIIEAIASGTRRAKYLESWFADGKRGNTGSLEKTLDTCLTKDDRIVGYVPWKAMEVHYRTIERKRDFLRDSRQKIEELWKTVHTIQSSDNPCRTLHNVGPCMIRMNHLLG